MIRRRPLLLLPLAFAWLASAALALPVILSMRECNGSVYAPVALIAIPASLLPGLWAAFTPKVRWRTVMGFMSLLVPPLLAIILRAMCTLASIKS